MDHHPQVQRIDDWINLLEQKAKKLLEGLDIAMEEMKPKEQLDGAVKLATLAQRYMIIRQQREAAEPPARNAILLTLMKQMRGELVEPIEPE